LEEFHPPKSKIKEVTMVSDFELLEVVIGILGLVLAVLLKLWDKNNRH